MANHLTRRDFLQRLAAMWATSLAAIACARPGASNGTGSTVPPTPGGSPETSPTQAVPPSPTPSPATQPAITAAQPKVPVSMVRGPDPSSTVARAVDMAGGLHGLKPGGIVLIKPNVNSDDPYPSTTNPAVVRAVVEVVKRYNPGRIVVADRSNASYNTLRAMQRTGIYEQASAAGAEVVGLENEEWVNVKPQGASHWRMLKVPRLLLDADYVISVPVAHTHFLAGYSMALKNWVGMIHPSDRNLLHNEQPGYDPSNDSSPPDDVVHYYGQRIAEANLPRRASFVVIDATKALISGGPFGGEEVQPGTVIASRDVIAADAAGLALLTYLGAWDAVSKIPVWQQPQIAHAAELGLGVKSYREIALSGEGVDELETIRALMA